jgi:hypothetical protein
MDNFITGTCNCISASEYEQNKSKIIHEIDIINNQLNPSNDDDGFTINISKKKKDELSSILIIKKKELNEIKRMVHLTEKGFIPLNVQIEIKKESTPKLSTEVQVRKTNKIVKPKF